VKIGDIVKFSDKKRQKINGDYIGIIVHIHSLGHAIEVLWPDTPVAFNYSPEELEVVSSTKK